MTHIPTNRIKIKFFQAENDLTVNLFTVERLCTTLVLGCPVSTLEDTWDRMMVVAPIPDLESNARSSALFPRMREIQVRPFAA